MVRKLLRGERTVGVLTFCGVAATVCLLLASLALTITYREQANDFKNTLYDRCQQRLTYDAANHRSIGADVALYKTLLAQNAQVPTADIPPDLRALAMQQRRAIEAALAEKERAYASSVPADCRALTR